MPAVDPWPLSSRKKPVELGLTIVCDHGLTPYESTLRPLDSDLNKRAEDSASHRHLPVRTRSKTPNVRKPRAWPLDKLAGVPKGAALAPCMPVTEPGDQRATRVAKAPSFTAPNQRPRSADIYRRPKPQSVRPGVCGEIAVREVPLESIAGDQWLSILERRLEQAAGLPPGTMENALAAAREPPPAMQHDDQGSGQTASRFVPSRPTSARRVHGRSDSSTGPTRPGSATQRTNGSVTTRSRPQSASRVVKSSARAAVDASPAWVQKNFENMVVVGCTKQPDTVRVKRPVVRPVVEHLVESKVEDEYEDLLDEVDDSTCSSSEWLSLEDEYGGWTYRRPSR